jgi:iron complex outermembrane recepter protein
VSRPIARIAGLLRQTRHQIVLPLQLRGPFPRRAALASACALVACMAQAQAVRHAIDLPAAPLERSLNELARLTGVQVLFASSLTQGRNAPALRGSFSAQEALDRLLQGTGLAARPQGGQAFTVEPASPAAAAGAALPEIRVTADAGRENPLGPPVRFAATRSATATKSDTPLLEVPQTVNVVTAREIDAQGAQNLGQTLRYTAGVLSETFGATSQFDIYTQVRGFRPDLYLDGVQLPYGAAGSGFASAVVDPYVLERVEVLKGPSSGLYGQSGPGGIVNMVSKRPTETPQREIELQAGSFGRKQVAADLSGPLNAEGTLRYRLVALAREAGTQVDFVDNDRRLIAPSITWQPDARTSFTLQAYHQTERNAHTLFNYLPIQGTLRPNINGRLPFERYAGEPDFDRLSRDQSWLGYSFEHRFSDTVSFRQNMRAARTEFEGRAITILQTGGLLPDQRTLRRTAANTAANASTFSIDNQLALRFDTGAVRHDALIGIDHRREIGDFDFGRRAAPSLDVYAPVYGQPIVDPGFNLSNTTSRLEQTGLYFQDQMRLGGWIATLGLRHDDAKTRTVNRRASTATQQSDSKTTGRIGLGYLFDNGVAPYVSYATSFQPVSGSSFGGVPFQPTTGKQVEAGLKYQPASGIGLFTASAFELTEQNRVTPDLANTGFNVQTGEVRVRGLELEAKTELIPGLNLTAAYAWLHHRITRSNTPSEVGARLYGTPDHQGSLWLDYELQRGALAGLGLSAGVRRIGATFDASNLYRMPAYTLVDIGLRYDLGRASPSLRGARLSLTASNLADRYYISTCNTTSGCTLGNRRTVIASLSYQW